MKYSFLLLALTAVTCLGQSPSSQKAAQIEELFRVSKMDVLLSKSFETITAQMKSNFLQQTLGMKTTPEQQKDLAAFQEKVTALIFGSMSWENVKPIYAKLYAEEFTDEEVAGLVAFYKTDVGKALVEKTPKLMADAGIVVQNRIATVQPELQKLIADFVKQAGQKAPQP